jgi:hypothetical protein
MYFEISCGSKAFAERMTKLLWSMGFTKFGMPLTPCEIVNHRGCWIIKAEYAHDDADEDQMFYHLGQIVSQGVCKVMMTAPGSFELEFTA